MLRILHSSYATERIAAATEFIQSFAAGTEQLIVGASREAADDLVRGIAFTRGATFGWHRLSFIQLAARLASPRLAEKGLAPGTSIGNDALAARAVYEELKQRRLKYFEVVAQFPGFAHATASTLSDLRLGGVRAEDMRLTETSVQDVSALLGQYDKQCVAAAIADRAALLRLAAEVVRTDRPFDRWPVLLLDVPIHSVAERDLLSALADCSRHVLLTCLTGDARTLVAAQPISSFVQSDTPKIPPESSLARLSRYLFSDDVPPVSEANGEVLFFSAPGEARECVEIARHILRLSNGGVRFDQIAILLRNPETYSGLMETALRRASIPAFFVRGSHRPDPSGRALLALLSCAAEKLSARRFAEYLSFAQVPQLSESGGVQQSEETVAFPGDESLNAISFPAPPKQETREQVEVADDGRGPELEGSLRTPWKWERLLVEAAVVGGKERWIRRLGGLEKQFQLESETRAREDPDSPFIETIENRIRNLRHLRSFAVPVIEDLAALPGAASWGEWIACLERLASKTLRDPHRVLGVLADMKPMSPVQSVSLEEVRTVLRRWLASVQPEPPATRYGRVFVGPPEQARGRSFEVVFLPGLAERMFPTKLREDPLLLDKLRKEISSELPALADRGQQERLLLQIAVGAARSRLYLSYPRVEIAEARPRVPSFYALDVARSITGCVPDHEQLAREAETAGDSRLAWPAPRDPNQAIDDSEYDLAVLRPLLSANRATRKGRLAYVMDLNQHLARSLRSRWARWNEKWSPQDGLCKKNEAVTEILTNFRLSSRPYSVSALQRFAVCPYQFLLSGMYRIQPREESSAIEQLEPMTRGAMFHEIQAQTLRGLQKSGWLPLTEANLRAAMTHLDQTVDRVASEYREELAPAIDHVWQDAVENMRGDLRVWFKSLAVTAAWVPIHFEYGFGFKPRRGGDPASVSEAVTLPSGERLQGFVDLIEESIDGKYLRITDHKTGKNHATTGLVVGGGEVLQPVVYGLAIESALKRLVLETRLFYCTVRGGFSEQVIPLDENARNAGATVLRAIDHAIANVFLVPAPRDGACADCEFQDVCGPYEETRIQQKTVHPELVRLTALRRLA
jgi:ATP-dependent helicase/nuclease subunit B